MTGAALIAKFPTSYEMEFSSDDTLLSCIGRNVVIHSLATRKRLSTSHPLSNPSHIRFSPDGRYLAVKSTSGQIVLLDPTTGRLGVDFANERDGEGSNLEFSECGDYLVDGAWTGTVTIRSTAEASKSTSIEYPGEMITTVCRAERSNTWAFLHQPKHGRAPIDVSPYVSLHQWPIAKDPFRIIRPPDSLAIHGAVLSPDGLQLAATHSGPTKTSLTLFSVVDGSIADTTLLSPIAGRGLRWSNDGRFIACIEGDGISVYSVVTLARAYRFDLKYPSSVSFSQDSSLIALGSWERGIVQSLVP